MGSAFANPAIWRMIPSLWRCNGLRRLQAKQRSASTTSRDQSKSHASPVNFRLCRTPLGQRRTFVTASLPSWLVPPAVFTGLFLGLWIYKCISMVVFQNKIIYMPYMPPFMRSESMDDYMASCTPVQWGYSRIKSLDGTKIALCVGEIPRKVALPDVACSRTKHVVVCYFQGNGGSLPPRLPMLSKVLKSVQMESPEESVRYTIVALSYRGYWKSSGRASQRGIEKDAQALLRWANATYASPETNLQLMLWGQSIGSGVATTAAASYVGTGKSADQAPIAGLVLETPFTSIRSMLLALYPQTWLPYRYLGPFLRSHWDSERALRTLAEAGERPEILILSAAKDEVVPSCEAEKLNQVCKDVGLSVERRDVPGALHTDATTRREGQRAVATFIAKSAQDARRRTAG